jgi:hypothetical protein
MPQLPESLEPKGLKRDRAVELEWRTISYRSVATAVILVFVGVGVAVYLHYREAVNRAVLHAFGIDTPLAESTGPVQQPVRFLNIEGTVRVKKANAFAWVNVSPSQPLPLDKGDVVQTGGDGYARILFADGTVYKMSPDTLVVVEENSSSSATKATNVAVTVTSGEVDLATTKFVGESKVTFANAVAKMGQDSRANVRNDPKSQSAQITLRQGESEISRGAERVVLGPYEQLSFSGDAGRMSRQRVTGAPLLLMPPDKAPVIAAEGEKPEVNFSWTPVKAAQSYRLRISTSPIFSTLVYDKRISSVSQRVNNLPEGTYYWAVSSLDAQGKESQPSDAAKFDLLRTVPKDEILLELQSFVLHGNHYEIVGRTEPGARVMVNDQPVFSVAPDGTFKHFTQALPQGTSQITVTAQNAKGQMAVRRKPVYIQ